MATARAACSCLRSLAGVRRFLALLQVAPLPPLPDVWTSIAHDTLVRTLHAHGMRSSTDGFEPEVVRRESRDPALFRTVSQDVAPVGQGIEAREPGAIVAARVTARTLGEGRSIRTAVAPQVDERRDLHLARSSGDRCSIAARSATRPSVRACASRNPVSTVSPHR